MNKENPLVGLNMPIDSAALADLEKFFQTQGSDRHPTKKRVTHTQRKMRRRRQRLARRANRGTGKGETRLSRRKP